MHFVQKFSNFCLNVKQNCKQTFLLSKSSVKYIVNYCIKFCNKLFYSGGAIDVQFLHHHYWIITALLNFSTIGIGRFISFTILKQIIFSCVFLRHDTTTPRKKKKYMQLSNDMHFVNIRVIFYIYIYDLNYKFGYLNNILRICIYI